MLVDFTWGGGDPGDSIHPVGYAIRWTGQVQTLDAPGGTSSYVFHVVAAGGVRLWVNSQLVIDDWTEHPKTDDSGTLALSGGQLYALQLEYRDSTDPKAGEAHLLWEPPASGGLGVAGGAQAIGKGHLFPPATAPPPAPAPDVPDASNAVSYLYADHLGSVVAEQAANGQVSYQLYTPCAAAGCRTRRATSRARSATTAGC